MSGTCFVNFASTWADNAWGQRLWTYELTQDFCHDGTWITYAATPIAGPAGNLFPCWSFNGNISGPTTSYGVGWNVVMADAQGHFSCSLPGFGVVDQRYPALHAETWVP
jgi:hypothetical protein